MAPDIQTASFLTLKSDAQFKVKTAFEDSLWIYLKTITGNQTMLQRTDNILYEWIFEASAVSKLLREIGFQEQIIEYVLRAAQEVTAANKKTELLDFCATWLERIASVSTASYTSQWQVLAVVSRFPATIDKHRTNHVPWEIIQATLLDLERRFFEKQARYGEWKFDSLAWMSNHLASNFFEIGRLQYIPGNFTHCIRVFREKETKRLVPLALENIYCDANGWAYNQSDSQTAYKTQFYQTEHAIVGHPLNPDGTIARECIRISRDSERLLDEHSKVLYIHIPWGSKLTKEICLDSLQRAKAFFAKYFSEIKINGFSTGTWLLDTEFKKILPPDSNIISFANLFHPCPIYNATDEQLLERVFNVEQWDAAQGSNSLQRALLTHHKSGGSFRSMAGFILAEEI